MTSSTRRPPMPLLAARASRCWYPERPGCTAFAFSNAPSSCRDASCWAYGRPLTRTVPAEGRSRPRISLPAWLAGRRRGGGDRDGRRRGRTVAGPGRLAVAVRCRGDRRGVAGRPAKTYSRFQAERPGDLWTANAPHGPVVAGHKAILFAAIDDHSRPLAGYRWAAAEDTVRLEAALRAGLAARGVPKPLYVDHGSPFASRQLERACAVLGIRLTHSRPGEPQGRGKIERVFRTVREQFLIELQARGGAADLAELNRLFRPGSRGSTTGASTPRPAARRWGASCSQAHRPCPAQPSCARRSCGPSGAPSPPPPP